MIAYRLLVPESPTLLAIVGLAIALGVVLIPVLRARREAARIEAASRAMLAEAAAALGLSKPIRVRSLFADFMCTGKMRDLEAQLAVSGIRGRASVSLVVEGLPSDVSVVPQLTGRAQEDFYLGIAVNSGYARFDAHYCLYGSNGCTGETLRAAALAVPHTLLDLLMDHFDASYSVTLSSSELVVRPNFDPARNPLEGPPSDLIALWRFAEKLVGDGIARGVFQSARTFPT